MASRMRSPMRVPPGSRVTIGSRPRLLNQAARSWSWVLLPAPSGPSKVMNRPRAIRSQHSHKYPASVDSAETPVHNSGDGGAGAPDGLVSALQALPGELGSSRASRLHGDGLQVAEAAVDRGLRVVGHRVPGVRTETCHYHSPVRSEPGLKILTRRLGSRPLLRESRLCCSATWCCRRRR